MQKIFTGDFLMLIVFFRALILYAVVFLVIRLMGKRELSKVQPFELAIIILIADLASAPMSSRGLSIFDGIVPIITLLVAYIIFTLLIQSSNKVQDVKCAIIETNGNLTVIKNSDNMNFIPLNIIEEGKISEVNTKILNMNNSDVEKLLHKNNIKLEDVLVGTMDENSKFIYQLKEEVKKDG